MSELLNDINEYLETNWESMVAQLDGLVQIPSTEDLAAAKAEEGEPFGPEPARALRCALDLAASMGFETTNLDGYIGYADFPGKTQTQIGIIGHMDVVPAGPGWTVEPFKVTRREGYLLGRGVIDDKGPSLMALHAMKFWLDRQRAGKAEALPYTIRFLFGANEETGMGDVPYYQERFEDPAFLFTPDAEFPVCYGEKGMFGAQLYSATLPVEERSVIDFDGGVTPNAVPGEAFAVVKLPAGVRVENLPAAPGITLEPVDAGAARVFAKGKSAHASTPELGTNAIGLLLVYLLSNNLVSAAERPFLELCQCVTAASDGSAAGLACSDEHFGPLTCVGSILQLQNDQFVQSVDVRYPEATTGDAVLAALDAQAKAAGGTAQLVIDKPVFFMGEDNPAIQALLSAYNEATGEHRKAFTMGGGTYARKFKCAAAFGAEKPWQANPEWVGGMHGPDEGVAEENLKEAFRIYALTIEKLMQLDLG